ENAFYEAGETLTEMSYQNPDSLQSVADALGIALKKSALFAKDKGEGIAAEEKIRNAAFTEEVLQGNNSTPVELGADKLVVLRMLEHKQAAAKPLNEVKQQVVDVILTEKAKSQAVELAQKIKARVLAGEALQTVAAEQQLDVKKVPGLTRNNAEVPAQLNQEIFKAAKPAAGKATVFTVVLPGDEQVVVSLTKVTPGVLSEDDKKKLDLAKKNIAKAFGQTEFNSVLNSLQQEASIHVRAAAEEKE
ncbi:MAG: peptidylprolyl isomerase, partial [Methylococcales bacterium]